MKTALVLEDLAESQLWLTAILEGAFPGIRVSVCGSLGAARRVLTQGAPDLALVDLGLPDGDGADFIAELNHRHPGVLCIVASVHDDDVHLIPALRAGAMGYLLKDQPAEQLVELLRGMAGGQPPLSPRIARQILAHFRVAPEMAQPSLTERETEVLLLLAKGMTNTEIAQLLSISVNTVPSYVREIYRKLQVCSRAEAAVAARKLGLV